MTPVAGDPLLVLDPAEHPAPADQLSALAQRYRLITPRPAASDADLAADPRDAARQVSGLLAELGVTSCGVVARGRAAAIALWLAIDHRDDVASLVLESAELSEAGGPQSPAGSTAIEARLFEAMPMLDVPTLILLGERTEAASPARAGAYKRLPASTIGLVYDASDDIRGERPEAFAAAVLDYLERGQAFVVSNRSTVIHA